MAAPTRNESWNQRFVPNVGNNVVFDSDEENKETPAEINQLKRGRKRIACQRASSP